jgi:hypothetical protein
MKIRPVVAELFHAGGRTDGQTERHDTANNLFFLILRIRLKIRVQRPGDYQRHDSYNKLLVNP